MIAAAQVVFRNCRGDGCLDWLSTELQRAGVTCSPTEWRGYGAVVRQLLVPTSPVPLTIQVDSDPAYLPDEIAELAEDAKPLLISELSASLRSCDTRVDAMSTTPPKVTETDRESAVFAQTDLDPANPEVERVLLLLSATTEGFIVDCVNGRLRAPRGREWTAL
jgi:hypothetical protein